MAKRKIIIIGGGAAGLMAAGQAAQRGAEVLVLEKMNAVGRKIFISGKGRCNITNVASVREFLDHFGPTGKFLRQAFHRYFSDDVLALLHAHG
ncbi:MAG: FAD-binding protein, partial [Chloroflexi bacterium]|nr:FAD-binding protein [Chloroflexota bacterium]